LQDLTFIRAQNVKDKVSASSFFIAKNRSKKLLHNSYVRAVSHLLVLKMLYFIFQ